MVEREHVLTQLAALRERIDHLNQSFDDLPESDGSLFSLIPELSHIDQALHALAKRAHLNIPSPAHQAGDLGDVLQLIGENRRQNALLNAIFEADPSPIAVLAGSQLRFAYANPAYRSLLPDTYKDPTGLAYADIYPRMDDTGIRERFLDVCTTGKPFQIVGVEHRFPDGSKLTFTLQARRITWEAEPAVLVLMWDITERTQAVNRWRENTQRLSVLTEAASALLQGEDPIARLNEFFKRFSDSLGLEVYVQYNVSPDGTHLELGSWAGFPEKYRKILDPLQFGQAVCGTVAQNRQPRYVNDVQHSTDPKVRLIKKMGLGTYACHPLIAHDRLLGTLSFGSRSRTSFTPAEIDLLRTFCNLVAMAMYRRLAEKSLQESEERFRVMVNHIPQLAWMADPDGWLFWYNQRWFDYTGETLEAMQGWGWQKVHHPEWVDRVTEKYRQHIINGLEWEDTFPLRRADGEYRWFLSRASPIRDASGKVISWFGTNTDITERMQLEAGPADHLFAENQAQKELLEQIIQHAPVGIAVLEGPEHRFTLVNPAQQRLFPFIPEFIGKTVREVWPDRAVTFQPVLDRVFQTGIPYSAVDAPWVVQTIDGVKTGYYSFSYTPLLGEDGRVVGILVLSVDTTEQVESRKAIEDSQERLKSVIEHAPLGIVVTDAQARVLHANAAAERLYARPIPFREDFSSHARLEICHPGGTPYDPRDLPLTRSALDGETHAGVELDIRWPDGQLRPLLVNTGPIRDKDGAVTGAVGVFQDISIIKETEQALRESEKKARQNLAELETLYQNAPMGLCAFDTELRWVRLNQRIAEINGFTIEEHLGKTPRDIVPDVADQAVAALHHILDTGEPLLDFEMSGTTRTQPGVIRFWNERWTPIKNEQGQILGISVAAEEITERKRAEAEARRRLMQIELQQRLLDEREQERLQIARDLHDGPMQELLGALYTLKAVAADETDRGRAGELNQVAETLQSQLAELRIFAQELRPPTVFQFGLEKAIRSHLEQFLTKHRQFTAQMDAHWEGGLLSQNIRLALFRICQEALTNIAKHCPQGKIQVVLSRNSQRVRLEIKDDGPGFVVPEDWLALARSGHLGIVGMRERLEAVGGALEVISAPGQGTWICGVVPLQEGEPSPNQA